MKLKILILITLVSFSLISQTYQEGKNIFNQNCSSCHQMDKKMVGPKLMNVVDKQSADWVYQWVKNNKELRETGDKHANDIYEEYGGAAMPVYEYLGEEKLKSVVLYLKEWKNKQTQSEPDSKEQKVSNTNQPVNRYEFPTWFKVITGALSIFIIFVFYLLLDVIKTLAKKH